MKEDLEVEVEERESITLVSAPCPKPAILMAREWMAKLQ